MLYVQYVCRSCRLWFQKQILSKYLGTQHVAQYMFLLLYALSLFSAKIINIILFK